MHDLENTGMIENMTTTIEATTTGEDPGHLLGDQGHRLIRTDQCRALGKRLGKKARCRISRKVL